MKLHLLYIQNNLDSSHICVFIQFFVRLSPFTLQFYFLSPPLLLVFSPSLLLSLPLLCCTFIPPPLITPLRFNEVLCNLPAIRASHLPSLSQVCTDTETHCSLDPLLKPASHMHTPANNNDTFIHLTHMNTCEEQAFQHH